MTSRPVKRRRRLTTLAAHLPEEVLFMIFKNVEEDPYDGDLNSMEELQYVCRAWHSVAHRMSLEYISLYDLDRLWRFNRSIDSNPHPTYLAAVEKIYINNTDYQEHFLTIEELQKTFFRFPNLKEVSISGNLRLFKEMTDELCQEFLRSCPKLEKFVVNERRRNEAEIYEESYNVRSLLTSLIIDKHIDETDFKTKMMEYITGCFNLRLLSVDSDAFDDLGKFLTAVEYLPNLKTIEILRANQDQEYFAENFLATKTQATQEQIIRRLSQLKTLVWKQQTGTSCVHTIKFIKKYMSGLTAFDLQSRFDQHPHNIEQMITFQTIMDLMCSVDACDTLLKMGFNTLVIYLPLVLAKIFHRPAIVSESTKARILRLKMTDVDLEGHDTISLTVNTTKVKDITVSVSTALNLEKVATDMFSMDTPLENVDHFYLTINKRDNCNIAADANVYCKILQGMKSIKSVEMDVPTSFKELSEPYNINTEEHPMVKKVTINATPSARFQSLLQQLSLTFPNVQHLSIQNFCGNWDRWMGEFQLPLPNYSLKELNIDVSPVMLNMEKHLNKLNDQPSRFFCDSNRAFK